ncbi:unnamed protein product [Ceutorhynchus assimilis]|uniref:Uncharacterized protein n=1 Tax=Ceutorhynchus assimilis TaxID=467358 RepID=A0A9N9N015_9CUCU|nr:unnamed protein product [Ceutorhynchus assimilis]
MDYFFQKYTVNREDSEENDPKQLKIYGKTINPRSDSSPSIDGFEEQEERIQNLLASLKQSISKLKKEIILCTSRLGASENRLANQISIINMETIRLQRKNEKMSCKIEKISENVPYLHSRVKKEVEEKEDTMGFNFSQTEETYVEEESLLESVVEKNAEEKKYFNLQQDSSNWNFEN